MIINLYNNIVLAKHHYRYDNLNKKYFQIENTIINIIEGLGYELKNKENNFYIIKKDIFTNICIDLVPNDIGEEMLKYNHYLQKGNIIEKEKILFNIVKYIEGHRKEYERINEVISNDFFNVINKLNVRHYNLEGSKKE